MTIFHPFLNSSNIVRLPFTIPVIVLFLLTSGCSKNFKTAAPYKNITIIYGLLDMGDTAHYIRVEKAFSDQYKSAFTMAQTPDSNFYASINVRIERFDFSGNSKDTIHLNRVDLNLEGYPKQAGVFYTAPNYAYKFTDKLDPHYIYRLEVTNLVTGVTNYADAPVINYLNDSIFSVGLLDNTYAQFDFRLAGIKNPYRLTGSYINTIPDFNFNGQNTPVGVAQAVIRFNWVDSDGLTNSVTDHYYDDYLQYLIPVKAYPGAVFEYDLQAFELYTALYSAMGPAPDHIYRRVSKCDISAYLSTFDFLSYQSTTFAQNTGLTGGYIEPIATNIKGPDALGLFTARAFKTRKVAIYEFTLDSFMQNPLFRNAMVLGASNH